MTAMTLRVTSTETAHTTDQAKCPPADSRLARASRPVHGHAGHISRAASKFPRARRTLGRVRAVQAQDTAPRPTPASHPASAVNAAAAAGARRHIPAASCHTHAGHRHPRSTLCIARPAGELTTTSPSRRRLVSLHHIRHVHTKVPRHREPDRGDRLGADM